jgi:hypothetical protein
MPLEEPLKNSLTMHTIIREVLTVERKQRVFSKHTCIYRISLTDKTKVSAEYTNMNYDTTTRWFN